MKKINYIFVLLFLFTSLSFAQLTVKDQESSPNTLLQVVDEGIVGSIFLPQSTTSFPSPNKLYNLNGTLIWNGLPLGTLALAGGWTSSSGKIFNTILDDKVGIGTTVPLSVLHLITQDNWNPSSGNGWGDFSISDGTKGLAIGMAVGGGGAGDIRIWAKGGTERIMIGDATNGDVLTTVDGKVGVGVSSPTAKLEVAGQVKITGGSPGDGKVLTSDADGLATWEENKIGFSAYISSNTSVPNNTVVTLSSFNESFDDGNGFNPTTGEYTIPSQGLYHFKMKIHWIYADFTPAEGSTTMFFYKNGSVIETLVQRIYLTGNNQGFNMSAIVLANAGDIITFRTFYITTGTYEIVGIGSKMTNVSGFKIY